MLKLINTTSLLFISSILFSTQSSANLILEEYATNTATPTSLGGYAMTDFPINNTTGGSSTSVDSPIDGTLYFEDKHGNPISMTLDLADNKRWWNNGELTDYDIYTTNLSLITILLPEDTRAFSFNVGAKLRPRRGDNAWLRATESDGSGITNKYKFNVDKKDTPGFGIYADNSNGSCSTLTSVTIDPLLWGFGNFSINQDKCGSVSVPAPAPLALLTLGLFGLIATRKNTAKK